MAAGSALQSIRLFGNLIHVAQMDGCPFSEPAFKYVASYLFILLFIYFRLPQQRHQTCLHQCVVKVNCFFFLPEIGNVQLDCWSFKLVTHGVYRLFNRINTPPLPVCSLDVGPSPHRQEIFQKRAQRPQSGSF